MRPDRQDRVQLFQFTVPGLSQMPLAVPLAQVLEVTELARIAPIPFAPVFVLGIAEWRSDMITVVDLAVRLCDDMDSQITQYSGWRYVIVQAVMDAKLNIVAWPILPGASVLSVPTHVPQAEVSGHLSSAMVYAALTLYDRSVALLNLEEIVALKS